MPDRHDFTSLPTHVDLPAMEQEILEWWAANDIFAASVARTADGPRWSFYEGPPTANGNPGTHHVEARAFKDVFPRYRTMKGYHVPRQAGWDCHGLPVEIAVEKELGLAGKPDIERIGIETFNEHCRRSVQRHVDDFTAMTERMGYWVDVDAAYWTMAPDYIEAEWWALARIAEMGLLTQDHRVAPYCPRCGTGLSDHEVAQGYEDVIDPSVYVRFPVVGEVAGIADVELLVWTTTPWTLVSNTAVAVHPEITYAIVRTGSGTFLLAEALVSSVLGTDVADDEQAGDASPIPEHGAADVADVEVLALLPGAELEKVGYVPPFDLVPVPDAHVVITADYVTVEDGTGLVHLAPAFGAEDLAACRRFDLPVVNPITPDGHFEPSVELVGGMFFTDANPALMADLDRRGLLLRSVDHAHPYPHCWRCHTRLMYYAQLSWYIRTTERIAELEQENERTNWYPDHIKHGRYGDWLANNVDWALSRNRYWGTPLPVWICDREHHTWVESRADLGRLAGRDLSDLDPHRPFIDEITFPCPSCGGTATRVPEVIDAWFDSGAMPFAQLGYPHRPGSVEEFEDSYPAQFICEAIDQTRGWFYTLMVVGTLVFDRSSYENVVCLGHIMAADGRKMSKHLGNVLEPMPLMDAHGADALRWFMLCSGSPWSARRISDEPLREIVRRVLLTYWNTAAFFTLYASTSDWSHADAGPVAERPVLDRWVLAELDHVATAVDTQLENFDTAGAGRALAQFIDDLSNWYVRRGRARFWAGDPAALSTLHTCLDTTTRLLAPFVPFVTERVWRAAVVPGFEPAHGDAPMSVHLADFPTGDAGGQGAPSVAETLRADMVLARQAVEAGRAVRQAAKIKIRQPLARAVLALPGGRRLSDELAAEVADELNVGRIEPLGSAGEVVELEVKPDFRALGKRFGSRTQQAAAAVVAADPAELAAAIRATGSATVDVDGEPTEITGDEVTLSEVPRIGWAVISQNGLTIALDTTITTELRRAGLAREAIRLIQTARKDAGLEVSDRIRLHIVAEGEMANALHDHRNEVADAVLAIEVVDHDPGSFDPGDRPPGSATAPQHEADLGLTFWLVPR